MSSVPLARKLSAALLSGALLFSFNAVAAVQSMVSPSNPIGFTHPASPHNILGRGSSSGAGPSAAEKLAAQELQRRDIFAKYADRAVSADAVSYKLGSYISQSALDSCRTQTFAAGVSTDAVETGGKISICLEQTPQTDWSGAAIIVLGALSALATVGGIQLNDARLRKMRQRQPAGSGQNKGP